MRDPFNETTLPKLVAISGPLKNLCEFIDDEWDFIRLNSDLCKALLNRLLVVQSGLVCCKEMVRMMDETQRTAPVPYAFQYAPIRPSIERVHSVYLSLESTVTMLLQHNLIDMDSIFDRIEARVRGTDSSQ